MQTVYINVKLGWSASTTGSSRMISSVFGISFLTCHWIAWENATHAECSTNIYKDKWQNNSPSVIQLFSRAEINTVLGQTPGGMFPKYRF